MRPVLVYQQQVASRRPRQDQRIVELGQWLPFTGVECGFIGVCGIGAPLLSDARCPPDTSWWEAERHRPRELTGRGITGAFQCVERSLPQCGMNSLA